MITRKYKIADKVVEVNSIYDEVHEYCADYLTDEPADYSVTTTQADIDFEREKSACEDEIEVFLSATSQTATSKNWQFTAR